MSSSLFRIINGPFDMTEKLLKTILSPIHILFHMYTVEHASNNTDLSIFSLRLHIEKDI